MGQHGHGASKNGVRRKFSGLPSFTSNAATLLAGCLLCAPADLLFPLLWAALALDRVSELLCLQAPVRLGQWEATTGARGGK